MNAHEINEMLASRAEEVCSHLLPGGKKKGNEWCVGDLTGSPGDSLKIKLTGSKAGYWADFANQSMSRGKNFLGLWTESKAIPYAEAIRQAKEFLGVQEDEHSLTQVAREAYIKPRKDKAKGFDEFSPAYSYMTSDRRIMPEVLDKYRVCETKDGKAIVFPFIENGEAVMLKYLDVERVNGKKVINAEKCGKPCLFGKNTVSDKSSSIIICEGEIDAMSWACWGFEAVSVPMGVANSKWIDLDWNWLERFDTIYLNFDNDKPGKDAAKKVVERLGRERCYMVELPTKDMNEYWVNNGPDPRPILAAAKPLDPGEIKRFTEFVEDVKKEFDWTLQDTAGVEVPWSIPLRIRPGEVTLFTGFAKHGKSAALLQLATYLYSKGASGMIASLEIPARKSIRNMIWCALAKKKPTDKEIEDALQRFTDMWIYDVLGNAKWRGLIETMRYARKRYGISFFIIDSLLKCGIDQDDYAQQKEFVTSLTDFANQTGAHVFVVAHSRKKEDESEPPNKQDVKGSGDIGDLVYNQVCVWRNYKKEEQIMLAKEKGDPLKVIEAENKHDAIIDLQFQRETGETRRIKVFYDRESNQFSDKQYNRVSYFAANPA